MGRPKLLEDIGRMVEIRKYMNKFLIVDFEIEKIEYEIFEKKIKFDKWLDFKDWLKIYEQIFKLLQNNKTSIKYLTNDFNNEKFKINNTVEVRIIKENLKEIIYENLLELKNFANFHMFILKIQVNLIIPENDILKNEIKISADRHEPIHHHNTRKSSNTNIPDVKEYFPAFKEITDGDKIPSYKPSKVVTEKVKELEPYSPEPVDVIKTKATVKEISAKYDSPKINKDPVPLYKASPIVMSGEKSTISGSESSLENYKYKSRSLRSTVRNKSRLLFGGSDSENEIFESKTDTKDKLLKSNSKSYQNDDTSDSTIQSLTKTSRTQKNLLSRDRGHTDIGSPKTKCDIENLKSKKRHNININEKSEKIRKLNRDSENKNSITGWLRKDNLRSQTSETSKKKLKHSEKSKLKSNTKIDKEPSKPVKLTDDERRILREKDEKDIETLLGFRDQIKEICKSPITVEYKTLHHLKLDKIIETYEKNKELLENQFANYKKDKSFVRKFEGNGLNHMFIHNLLDDKNLMEMSKFLHDIFEPNNFVPEFTDIFFGILVPEWVLLVYMDEYNMTRSEAIQYIKDQEEYNICSQMDNTLAQ